MNVDPDPYQSGYTAGQRLAGQIVRWLRVPLPAMVWLGAFVLCIGILELFRLIIEIRWRQPAAHIYQVRDVLLFFTAAVYGIYRVGAFHPLFSKSYREWLEATPWQSQKALPAGPIVLVPQDLLLMGLLVCLQHDSSLPRWIAPLIALNCYVLALVVSLSATNQGFWCYIALLSVAIELRLCPHPWLMGSFAIIACMACWRGLERSLAEFPWTDQLKEIHWNEPIVQNSSLANYGWPHAVLHPQQKDSQISVGSMFMTSLLIAFYCHDIDYLLADLIFQGNLAAGGLAVSSIFPVVLVPIAITIRLGAYLAAMNSPINLWGRLLSGRWIIPAYDQVFLGPFITAVATGLCFLLPQVYPLCTYRMVAPLANGMFIFLIVSTGPKLRRWQLTAPAMIYPSQLSLKQGKHLQEI